MVHPGSNLGETKLKCEAWNGSFVKICRDQKQSVASERPGGGSDWELGLLYTTHNANTPLDKDPGSGVKM